MVSMAFHLFSYTVLFFAVGMYKPKWALFLPNMLIGLIKKEWELTPTRFLVSSITLVAVMIAMTVYGEGHKEEVLQAKKVVESAAPVSEMPEAK